MAAKGLHEMEVVNQCLIPIRNSTEMTLSPSKFCQLPLHLAEELLMDNNLQVEEIFLFNLAVEWSKSNGFEANDEQNKKLMQQIRFPLIDQKSLVSKVKPTGIS